MGATSIFVEADSVLLTLDPTSLVLSLVAKFVQALTMSLVFVVVPNILFSVLVFHVTLSVHSIIVPLTSVLLT